jgi:hypothetical protein
MMKNILLALATASSLLLLSACDPFDCAPQTCDNGAAWKRCVVCSTGGLDTLCTAESRDGQGNVLSSCDYKSSSDSGPRNQCFDQVNSAASSYCSAAPQH